MKIKRNQSAGFTLVEILVIAPIVILVIGAFVGVTLTMTGEILTTRANDSLLYSVQDSLDRMSTDVRSSNNFLAANNITISSPQGSDNSTAGFVNVGGANGPELILDSTATTANPNLLTSQPVYLQNSPNACASSAVQQNATLHYNIVYFVNNNTLYRRIITNSNFLTAGCTTPWQRPNCAAGMTGALCKTNDEVLISNVSGITLQINYYTSANDSSPIAGAVAGSDDARNTALQTANTIQVQLTANTTVAGRDFSRSATAKAVRASTVTTSQNPDNLPGYNTVPSAPVVHATYDPTNGVTFNWPAVSPAATYKIEYQLNGGSWVTATNSTTNTYYNMPMTTIYNGETIAAQITASTQAGSSTAGTATITTPVWNNFDYINGWLDYHQGYTTAAYTKTSAGLILWKGLVANAFANGTQPIAVLPPAFRPSNRLLFYVSTNANVVGRVDFDSLGNVIPSVASPGWFGIDGVAYLPASTPMTAVTAFSNGWGNYSSAFAGLQYATDGAGRTVLEGLVGKGTLANGTLIAALPTAILPSLYQHIAEIGGGNGASMIGIDVSTSFGIVAKNMATNDFLGTNAVFYPSSYASWTNLTLQNSWTTYGGIFATPQYTTGTDGVVVLKGLIKGGTATFGTVIANLPPGYRPAARILYGTMNNGAYGRIDILPTGDIIAAMNLSSNVWLSLDNFHFVAEQ
jgi:type II secretory pathway pseudopilin PulG